MRLPLTIAASGKLRAQRSVHTLPRIPGASMPVVVRSTGFTRVLMVAVTILPSPRATVPRPRSQVQHLRPGEVLHGAWVLQAGEAADDVGDAVGLLANDLHLLL